MRYDEEMGREALSTLLKHFGAEGIWKEGPDPPDWFLDVAGQPIAVEITSVHGSTEINGRGHTWLQLSKELLRFAEEVCSEVETRAPIEGCFVVSFPAVPRIKSQRSAIVQALTVYFETLGSTSSPGSWHTVLSLEGRDVAVYKIRDAGSSLISQALLTGAVISRLEDQLSEILFRTVSSKALKMSEIPYPAILVILDEYGFQKRN